MLSNRDAIEVALKDIRKLKDYEKELTAPYVKNSLTLFIDNLEKSVIQSKNKQIIMEQSITGNSVSTGIKGSSSSSSSNSSGASSSASVEKLLNYKLQLKNKQQQQSKSNSLLMMVHSIMIGEGFVGLFEGAGSSVPGFASPLKELPPNKFLPDNWNGKEITYKHKKLMVDGSKIKVKVDTNPNDHNIASVKFTNTIDTNPVVYAQYDDNYSVYLTSNVDPMTATDISDFYVNFEKLRAELVKILCGRVYERVESSPIDITSSITAGLQHPKQEQQQQWIDNSNERKSSSYEYISSVHATKPNYFDSSAVERVRDQHIHAPSIGNRDLNPFPNGIAVTQPGSYAGNEMGPDHPFFISPEVQFPEGANGRGSYIPEARFDPYGPVGGANSPDFGNVGRGGVILPGGRGRGRFPDSNRFRPPGEPNPDHLKPPGW